jgi:cyanophycinase
MAAADAAWLALLPSKPRVLVLPTANTVRPDIAAANGVRHFEQLGAIAEALMVTDRDAATKASLVRNLDRADAVYMAGGEPAYLRDVLKDSPLWRAMLARWREGMALGGSSAGAMVLAEVMYLRGAWLEGLGPLDEVAVLPHFNRLPEDRRQRAWKAMAERGVTGLGIDEGAAVFWASDGWRVAGTVTASDSAGIGSLNAPR